MVRHKMRHGRPTTSLAVDFCVFSVLPVLAAVAVILWHQVHASEFPERECCDPIHPPMPEPEPLPPALPTATTSSSLASPIGRSGTELVQICVTVPAGLEETLPVRPARP